METANRDTVRKSRSNVSKSRYVLMLEWEQPLHNPEMVCQANARSEYGTRNMSRASCAFPSPLYPH
ncbi:unnamed protein product, partial [Nesidiocoris tenuis]